MTTNKDDYQICQASFAVPDEQTARRIFEEALGLKLFTKTGLAYWINSIAVLFCIVTDKQMPGSKLHLFAQAEKIKNIAEKLNEGHEKVQLDEKELPDGRVNFTLQITTTVGSTIIITNRGR